MGQVRRRGPALCRRLVREDDGNGPMTATGGVLMFLFFLFITVQAALHLYANTQAAAIALEGASRVARDDMTCAQASSWVSSQVSNWNGVDGSCTIVGDRVEVTVSGASPAPALRIMGNVWQLETINRTGSSRMEEFR
ncbi:MAG TPA: hypothetical protein VJ978_04155 [Nitriliruptoraceae bacterium]|nr:hypothetical protein [Nitriliruptoraceae bacterium]